MREWFLRWWRRRFGKGGGFGGGDRENKVLFGKRNGFYIIK